MVTSLRLRQDQKEPWTLVTPLGILTLVKAEPPKEVAMLVRPLPNLMLARLEQFSNAKSPMVVTLSGSVRPVMTGF